MRSSDWSSDVCSSDLYRSTPAVLAVADAWLAAGGAVAMGLDGDEPPHRPFRDAHAGQVELWAPLPVGQALDAEADDAVEEDSGDGSAPAVDPPTNRLDVGRASGRDRVWSHVRVPGGPT